MIWTVFADLGLIREAVNTPGRVSSHRKPVKGLLTLTIPPRPLKAVASTINEKLRS